MATIEPLRHAQVVNIDFPFFQGEDYRADGSLATSFVTVKEMIDRAVEIGFDGVAFDTNVPIDIQTGELYLYVDVDGWGPGNADKSFSEEVWKSIEYAESLGLTTEIHLNIRNALNDVSISTDIVGDGFSTEVFFESVKSFETELAEKAQSYGVDVFTIGSFNFGYVESQYQAQWTDIVESIRGVYDGTLRYKMNIEASNIPLWNLVDDIQIKFGPVWPLESDFKAEDFVSLYFQPYIAGNGSVSTKSTNELISEFQSLYPDKSISLQVQFDPGRSAGHETEDAWGYVFTPDPSTPDGVKTGSDLRLYPEEWIDYSLNQEKIKGFFEYLGNYLSDNIAEVQYWQFAPWTETWVWRDPPNFEAEVWQSVIRAGATLNYNPYAQETLSTYLLNDWGYHTLYYGTNGTDTLTGSPSDDKFFSSDGNDFLRGGAGVDTVVYAKPFQSIAKSGVHFLVDGDTLSDIERVIFSDVSIALDALGNAGNAARILATVFGKATVSNPALVGIALSLFDQGMSLEQVSELALSYALGNSPSSEAVVRLLWGNVIGSEIDSESLVAYSGLIDSGQMSAAQLTAFVASTDVTAELVNLAGLAQTGLEYI